MKRRVQAFVEGRVQGVCYRASAAEEARARGVGGWVRNLPDGRVELVAEGEASAVDAFLEWCREGPPFAVVRRFECRDLHPTGEGTRFEIRHDG